MRGISEKFISDLLCGKLSYFGQQLHDNNELCLCVRDGYINIYYKGGNALKISEQKTKYKLEFDSKYCINGIDDDKIEIIKSLKSTDDFELHFSNNLNIMDNWFKKNPKAERLDQHNFLIHNDNIIDIEYQIGRKSWFDMIMYYGGKLVIVENKTGTGAISGSAALSKHYKDIQYLLENHKDELASSMINITKAKKALALSNIEIVEPTPKFEILFLMVDYNAKSMRIKNERNEIEKIKTLPAKILFLNKNDYRIDLDKAEDFFEYGN